MFNRIVKKQKNKIAFLEKEKKILEDKQQDFIDEAKEMNKIYDESFNDFQTKVVYMLSEIQSVNSTGNTGEEKKKRINAIIYKFKKEMNI